MWYRNLALGKFLVYGEDICSHLNRPAGSVDMPNPFDVSPITYLDSIMNRKHSFASFDK